MLLDRPFGSLLLPVDAEGAQPPAHGVHRERMAYCFEFLNYGHIGLVDTAQRL